MSDTMTPRERWLAAATRHKPDRVPMYYRATAEATAKLLRHLGCDEEAMYRRLHIDREFYAVPRYVGPPIPPDGDMYGRRFKNVAYEGGIYPECANAPLADCASPEEIDRVHTWPSADWFDYTGIPDLVAGHEDSVIYGGLSEPFLIYKDLRGDEQAFIDLIENPEIVHHCLGRLYDFCLEDARRIYEQIPGKVTVTDVSEDVGAQDRLLYSRPHLQEYFFPYMRKMVDQAHDAGALVNMHSDGDITEILDDIVAMGVDVINPIQWRCGRMDRARLKQDYGDRLAFEGAMDNQQTLPFGSVDDVRNEARENIDLLGKEGGYILTPCHNIQVVGPAGNVITMYEAAYEAGWY